MKAIAIPYERLRGLGFQRIRPGKGWKYTQAEPKEEEIRDTTKLMEMDPAKSAPPLSDYLGKVLRGASTIVRRVRDTLYVPHRATYRGKLVYEESQEDTEIQQLSKDETDFILKSPARIEINPDLRKDLIDIARTPRTEDVEKLLETVYDKIRRYEEPMRTTLEWEFDCAALARSIGNPERYIAPNF